MSRYSDTYTASQTGDWIMGTARRNPEALLLIAAGACLLMRSGGGSVFSAYSGSRYREGDRLSRTGTTHYARAGERSGEYASNMKDRASEYASDVKDRASNAASSASSAVGSYAADIKDRVSSTASSYADAVSEYASDARRNISEQTGRFARQAQSSMERIIQDQPLAVALAGLAAGAAVAAAFPRTDIENRTLGRAREALTDAAGDAAKEAGERLMGAAGKAVGEGLKGAAERGLSTEGLKDMARDVAQTFTSAAKGTSSDLGSPSTVPESPSTGANLAGKDADRASNMARASEPSNRSNR